MLRGCSASLPAPAAAAAPAAARCAARLRRDLWRLIAERTGHALHAVAAMRVLARLLAAHDLRVGIEALARLLGHREIDLGRHARAHALGADDRPSKLSIRCEYSVSSCLR